MELMIWNNFKYNYIQQQLNTEKLLIQSHVNCVVSIVITIMAKLSICTNQTCNHLINAITTFKSSNVRKFRSQEKQGK